MNNSINVVNSINTANKDVVTNNSNNVVKTIGESLRQPTSSDSDFANDDEGDCEEVGFEDYDDDKFDDDEGEIHVVAAAKQPSQAAALLYGSQGSQRQSNLGRGMALNQLSESGVKETDQEDEEYSEIDEDEQAFLD